MIEISSRSRQYLRVSVTHRRRPPASPPITGDTVEFAFLDNPGTGDWHSGSWQVLGTTVYARVLVGPGAVELPAGRRPVLVRVTDNPERPVLRAGHVMVVQ